MHYSTFILKFAPLICSGGATQREPAKILNFYPARMAN